MGHHRPNAPARKARQIRHRLANLRLDECDAQAHCRLFTVLPTEVRLMVFEYALAEHEDKSFPLQDRRSIRHVDDANGFRPSNIWETRIYTALLFTCKRVYCEASHLPLRLATITTHSYPLDVLYGRRPPHFPAKFDVGKLQHLTASNLRNLQRVSLKGPLWTSDISFLECRRDEVQIKFLDIHLSPSVSVYDTTKIFRHFGVCASTHRDTQALLDLQVRGPYFQLVPTDPDLWGYRTDQNFVLPQTLAELNIYLETEMAHRDTMTKFLMENGTQIAPLYRGSWLSTKNNPITWESWYKFDLTSSDMDDLSRLITDEDFANCIKEKKWYQSCCARIKYTRETQIPRWADFEGILGLGDNDDPDPQQLKLINEQANPQNNLSLASYLDASLRFHKVETVIRRAEGLENCSLAIWLRQMSKRKAEFDAEHCDSSDEYRL